MSSRMPSWVLIVAGIGAGALIAAIVAACLYPHKPAVATDTTGTEVVLADMEAGKGEGVENDRIFACGDIPLTNVPLTNFTQINAGAPFGPDSRPRNSLAAERLFAEVAPPDACRLEVKDTRKNGSATTKDSSGPPSGTCPSGGSQDRDISCEVLVPSPQGRAVRREVKLVSPRALSALPGPLQSLSDLLVAETVPGANRGSAPIAYKSPVGYRVGANARTGPPSVDALAQVPLDERVPSPTIDLSFTSQPGAGVLYRIGTKQRQEHTLMRGPERLKGPKAAEAYIEVTAGRVRRTAAAIEEEGLEDGLQRGSQLS